MGTAHLIGVEEYLHSSFEPDAEYVEGRIVTRAMPQRPHSMMQGYLYRTMYQMAHPGGYKLWLEQRIRTKSNPARYRIPDLCLTFGDPHEDVFIAAPYLCIEILSPEDSEPELRTKIDEYLAMGVAYVWVVDPISLKGEIHTAEGIERVEDGRFRAGDISVDVTNVE